MKEYTIKISLTDSRAKDFILASRCGIIAVLK